MHTDRYIFINLYSLLLTFVDLIISGIIVDLFSDAKVLPQLQEVCTCLRGLIMLHLFYILIMSTYYLIFDSQSFPTFKFFRLALGKCGLPFHFWLIGKFFLAEIVLHSLKILMDVVLTHLFSKCIWLVGKFSMRVFNACLNFFFLTGCNLVDSERYSDAKWSNHGELWCCYQYNKPTRICII